jgi:hypothetical protein
LSAFQRLEVKVDSVRWCCHSLKVKVNTTSKVEPGKNYGLANGVNKTPKGKKISCLGKLLLSWTLTKEDELSEHSLSF